ncbi:ATP-dependent DNA helicase pif1 [Brachionus plicatilis]|uniref:ATP-dependent DNA helicase pif1 n=1 Tax=Brachionus plicatilis TaxID=10195 RepID=A0A3M7T2K9_BRAPC|nr:ATP-dependent DNA helicase pif1 [Brachionus plicatilis]
MKRMTAYSSNITGSDSYKRRTELEATFEQKGCATVFFTFSYADNHWHDLHRLMPGQFTLDKNKRYQNVLNNPHLVDWYFTFRLNEFLKVVFDGILDCEWRWHRYEWQSRSTIHAHGAAKFKNDPGLRDLTTKVYQGRMAEKQILTDDISPASKNGVNELIYIGKKSEKILIDYTNTLLTAMNPRTNLIAVKDINVD